MNNYAQINAGGVCFAQLGTSAVIDSADMVQIGEGENRLRERWTGEAWEIVPPSEKEAAIAGLLAIDAETGLSRTLREAIISIGKKVAADVSLLEAKEAEAVALRVKAKAESKAKAK